MSDEGKAKGKVEIKIGNLSFSAEGDQGWLAEQIAKVMETASASITKDRGASDAETTAASARTRAAAVGSLAAYIRAKAGEANQVQRFLATAAWLYRGGTERLTPKAVASALSAHHQKKLVNPSECLNKNCNKGFCEKTGDGFFITPEGWKALGEEQ